MNYQAKKQMHLLTIALKFKKSHKSQKHFFDGNEEECFEDSNTFKRKYSFSQPKKKRQEAIKSSMRSTAKTRSGISMRGSAGVDYNFEVQGGLNLFNISVELKKRNIGNFASNSMQKTVQQYFSDRNLKMKNRILQMGIKNHHFFKKIDKNIAKALFIVASIQQYQPTSIIFNIDNQRHHEPCLGILLYGKINFSNDSLQYRHTSKQSQTLFEHKFIRFEQSYPYNVEALTQCAILWVSHKNYEIVRKQCFISLDLKYKFHQFQNLLKYYLVNKKMQKIKENWKFFQCGKIITKRYKKQ